MPMAAMRFVSGGSKMVDRSAFRFFLERAGYCTPPGRAKGAIQLARAEQLLGRALELGVASLEWVDDVVPYDQGDSCSDEQARRYFESNAWTGPFGCVVEVDGSPGASLWGIVVGPRGLGDPYCRVVQAELSSECEDDLRQAIGDHLDAAALVAAVGVVPPSFRAAVFA